MFDAGRRCEGPCAQNSSLPATYPDIPRWFPVPAHQDPTGFRATKAWSDAFRLAALLVVGTTGYDTRISSTCVADSAGARRQRSLKLRITCQVPLTGYCSGPIGNRIVRKACHLFHHPFLSEGFPPSDDSWHYEVALHDVSQPRVSSSASGRHGSVTTEGKDSYATVKGTEGFKVLV